MKGYGAEPDVKLKNLKLIREQNNYTQNKVSNDIQVSQELVSQWELGRSLPNSKTINVLCDYFNCSADFLLDRTNVATPVGVLVSDKSKLEYVNIIELYKSLSNKDRQHFISYLNYLSTLNNSKEK